MALFAEDFVFNNKSIADFGFMMCEFDSSGTLKRTSAGSSIDLKTVKIKNNWKSTSNDYKEAISFSFSICKKDFSQISSFEQATINRNFIRKDGYKYIQFIMKEFEQIFFNVMCTGINAISVGNIDYGLELSFIADAPYGYGKREQTVFNMTSSTLSTRFVDMSDEVGETFPDMIINILENCNFQIYNALTNTTFRINNCKAGETITINSSTGEISTTLSTHSVVSDFNLVWFRFANTYDTRHNQLTFTGKAKVTMIYRQIRKVGVG